MGFFTYFIDLQNAKNFRFSARARLASRLDAAAPKLSEAEPGFRVPEFVSDAEEIAWLDRNHERLAELTLKHGARVQLSLKEPTKQISIRVPVRDLEKAKQRARRGPPRGPVARDRNWELK